MSQATPTIDTPPEVSTFESNKDKNITSSTPEHTYNMDWNTNIGITILEPTSTSIPPLSIDSDADFIVGDEQQQKQQQQ